MHPKFAEAADALDPSYRRLMEMEPIRNGVLPKVMPSAGIYLFSEGNQHLYIGRTNTLRRRYRQHTSPGSPHNQAVFAFRIARLETGRLVAEYRKGEGNRAELVKDAEFGPAFVLAKSRLRSMDFRYVEEVDPVKQTLLEIYCAVVLGTPFNDFNNH